MKIEKKIDLKILSHIYTDTNIMALLHDCSSYDAEKNDYYTQKTMWAQIAPIVKRKYGENARVWEACMLNSKSKSPQYLTELGFEVKAYTNLDCRRYGEEFKDNYDCIITNPPFKTDLKRSILRHFYQLDKPFVIVMNVMNVFSKYMRDIFGEDIKHLQVIYPQGKILFEEWDDKKKEMIKCKKAPSFYCVFVCYKMDIPPELMFISK